MKKNFFIAIVSIIYLLAALSITWYFLFENKIIETNNKESIETSKEESFTGNTFDPSYTWLNSEEKTQTWVISPETNSGSAHTWSTDSKAILDDLDRIAWFKENGFYRIYNPPVQPKVSWSYEEKSAILNSFITKNNFHFTTTSKLSEWYLLIRTEKPLWKNDDIFLYFHNTSQNWYPVSWKISKIDTLSNSDKWEYIYKIDDLPIFRYYDKKLIHYNWLENELINTKKIHFIAWYITTSSGNNSIREIIIAWK